MSAVGSVAERFAGDVVMDWVGLFANEAGAEGCSDGTFLSAGGPRPEV